MPRRRAHVQGLGAGSGARGPGEVTHAISSPGSMQADSRGFWAWGVMGAEGAHSRDRRPQSGGAARRRLLVCGLLLLTMPAASSDLNGFHSASQARGSFFSDRSRAASSSVCISSAFVSGWAPGSGAKPAGSLCARGARGRPIAMVSAQPRPGSGSSGDRIPQPRNRKIGSGTIVDGVNKSFNAVVSRGVGGSTPLSEMPSKPRRRGIGSRSGDGVFAGRVSRAAAQSIAAAKKITLLHEQEFLNQDALLRQATEMLVRRADDMTGGARWGMAATAGEAKAAQRSAATPKSRRRGYEKFTNEEESVTDAMVAPEPDNFYDYSPDLEQDWEAQKKSVAKPKGAQGRWRSRLRSIRPEYSVDTVEYSVEEMEHVEEVERQREIQNQELMRKVTILTKGRAHSMEVVEDEGQEGDVFLNPGFIDERREKNERAALDGGLTSGVGLSELARRGLVGRNVNVQDLHRGAKAVGREVDLGGAVFDLKVVGDRMYSAGSDDSVTLYDTKTWEKVGVLTGHEGWVNAMAVDQKRRLLYTASEDESVKVWDMKTLECVHTLWGHDNGALSLQLVDTRLVVGCTGRILVWDTKSWELIEKHSNHTQVLRAMSDGKQLSKNLGIDPRIAIAREASKLSGLKVGGLAANKRYIFSAVDEGNIWVWEKRHMEVERKLLGPKPVNSETVWVRSLEVVSVTNPKNGKESQKLLSGWADGAVRVFDIATWTLEHTLTAHSGPILSLAVVGDVVISTGADMTAAEWDPATWTLRRVLRNHGGAVCAVSALEDGRVITASLDGKLKVWNKEVAAADAIGADGTNGGRSDGGNRGGGHGGGGGLGGKGGGPAPPASAARASVARGTSKRGSKKGPASVTPKAEDDRKHVSMFAEL